MWGAIADRKGRKPVIIVSNILIAISTIAFGFSVNFAMAVAMRVLMGFFNGTISVAYCCGYNLCVCVFLVECFAILTSGQNSHGNGYR